MNGLCPACRRPYDEKTIQWKVVTSEEVAEFRANIQKNQKKRAQEQKQKEVQKREAEKENRKNLVGVRVVQKNLVYVTGLTPTVREDELLKTLRKPEFFGQYGNIQKISISNRKSQDGQNQSLGIYVTFEKKEEAQRCIQAVNGSQNGDRVLRAQLGTTKYCSAWLRHEQCTNRQCMFLHELGDEEDSYTRQDLSSMNSISSQRPLAGGSSNSGSGGANGGGSSAGGPSRTASRQQNPSTAAPGSQPMARSSSKEGSENDGDGSALPSSANWARNPQRSRRGSHATSGAASSPAISTTLPATAEAVPEAVVETPSRRDSPVPATESKMSRSNTSSDRLPSSLPDNLLKKLLKAMQGCPFRYYEPDTNQMETIYPPMFDIHGGERRRRMREEDEVRLSVDQEQQSDVHEPSEGEPETGGSLALGGEPEDRDMCRDVGFDQRRPGTQPPIQRTNADGLFGPALSSGFGKASVASGSVAGSRSMTPQQQLYMTTPSGFGDHLPPGIVTPQPSAQQGGNGGHNRHGSRFSFANDSASTSASVKVSANPRIMAQQSTMMPTAFGNQPGSQFYASSMPGPPPGLKSTGTPPNMFGQGQGFGNAAYTKQDPTELLQSLIRGRGTNGQGNDAGKREYMLSSFSNQYQSSTSSTPAPAPNFLASLYGNQPGAFQDFGPKQKKKGKKHRHANTSSSGGGGLVDLADPSILQARMQHQPQSNAGVGQGLFGGQSQDDELLETPPFSVDELVSDDPLPAFGAINLSRPAVPTPPPGLAGPPPGLGGPQRTASPAQRQVPVPAVPVTNASTAPKTTPSMANVVQAATPDPSPRKKVPGSEAKTNIKALAVQSGLSKDIASQSSPSKANPVLQEKDFPALDAVKANAQRPGTPAKSAVSTPKIASTSIKKPVEAAASAAPKVTPKAVEKKPAPVLNIAAATKVAPQKQPESADHADSSAFPALPTPTTASVASPVTRVAPKTLRVVPTPKHEVPPALGSGAFSAAARAVSSASCRPGTPASEIISDSASIVSASISRGSSPPPSKIGSAPVRATTKSQQRKQRQLAHKEQSAVIAETVKVAEPEEQAPIIGRKKKQKKEKPAPAPSFAAKKAAEKVVTPPEPPKKEEPPAPKPILEQTIVDLPPPKGKAAKVAAKAKAVEEKAKTKDVQLPTPPAAPTAAVEESSDTTDDTFLMPENVYQTLREMGEAPPEELLALIKPIIESTRSFDRSQITAMYAAVLNSTIPPSTTNKGIISEADHAALLSGKPIRKVIDGQRVLITPNGDCVRNLSEEEEKKYLELQADIAKASDRPDSFVAPRHQARPGGFSLIKGRAVPNGPPSYFPPSPKAQKMFSDDPVNKMQREEAISYINQYVLPRLNLGNTNLFPGSWKTPNGAKDALSARETAAASLNSLAPYIYGHDAAAGAGIYSAESGGSGKDIPEDETPFGGLDSPNNSEAASNASASAAAAAAVQAHAQHSNTHPKLPGTPLNSMTLMSVDDAETALTLARKETDKLEKNLNQVIKRNRRILLGSR
ncbi:General negative regulator of transcription subunit 4 [Colletotrichum trifolii]|uniref:General negative regulator of transcription subunit 4 n=1 Tax=Colletotrichum trifolii TaxID=5466 RepID=A0A4R8RK39_COLTR|nr:General negative regulator of transcription subunit 4 [Colletotrichum trifolii]